MTDAVRKQLNDIQAHLENLSGTPETLCIDADGVDGRHDLAHRAGMLHKAIEGLRDDLRDLLDKSTASS